MNSVVLLPLMFLALRWDTAVPAVIQTCSDVPEVENANYTVLNDTSPGVRVRYSCNDGHYLTGTAEITCSSSLNGNHWHPDPPICHVKRCPELWRINAGYTIGDEDCCPVGYKLRFACYHPDKYQLVGAGELTCSRDGSWDHPVPECLSRNCKPLDDLPHGYIDYFKGEEMYFEDDVEHGVEAHFTCDEGHDLIGPQIVTCQNREWTPARPRCKPQDVAVCEDIVVPNSELAQDKSYGDYFAEGDMVLVSCKHGYRINGTDYLECNNDGTWSDPAPSCVEYNCTREELKLDPHMIVEEFVDTNVTEFPVDSRVYLKCKTGYMLEGASSLICANGGWSGKAKCKRIHCGRPSVPEFGWMTVSSTYIEGVASFGCRQGYRLVGSEDRFCLANGVWSGTVARCVSEAGLMANSGCESPGIPDNGVKIGTYYKYGAIVKFSCNPGYQLRGVDAIKCSPKGTWSDPIPSCLGPFYYDIPWNVKESLMNPFAEFKNTSDVLNHDADGVQERALNLNISGVRHVVYFVIDASSSMGGRDFKKGIALTEAIVKKINVTDRGHRVGVITFSTEATQIVLPHREKTMDEVLAKLRNITYTGGGTALTTALLRVKTDFDTARLTIPSDSEKLHLSIFLITDGKANLGGSPRTIMTDLQRRPYNAEVYGIAVTTSPDRDALTGLVSKPVENHLFILRDYDSYLWLAETLTNGTIDYSECGSTHRHNIDTGKEDVAEARIAGGEDVETPWPWMVEVKSNGALCGGSIISRTWILTAAHCVCASKTNQTLSNDLISVRLGLTDTKNEAFVEEPKIKSIVRHPDYTPKPLVHDIALIELESNITYGPYIRRICLPPENLDEDSPFYREGKPAFVIGWGRNGTRKISIAMLQQVKATIVSNENCTRAYQNVAGAKITGNVMCAGGYGTGDSCQGDSGGPLMQGIAKDEYIWTQVGIVSFGHGDRCNKKDKPGVYTNVAKYRRWIDEYVKDTQEARN